MHIIFGVKSRPTQKEREKPKKQKETSEMNLDWEWLSIGFDAEIVWLLFLLRFSNWVWLNKSNNCDEYFSVFA